MNIGFMACIVLAILFLIMGIIFFLLKEKGAKYVSGFSALNHPEKYDKTSGTTSRKRTHKIDKF